MMRAFPLPELSTAGTAIAPGRWGCHTCGRALSRKACCQRAVCWSHDERGGLSRPEHVGTRLDAPCDIPPIHCPTCCTHIAARVPGRDCAASRGVAA